MKSKTLLLMLLMALCMPFVANAYNYQVQVGDGTSTQFFAPINLYYNYSYTQQIYTAEQINASCPVTGDIESISFYYAGNVERTVPITVYMMHTTKDAFESDFNWVTVTDNDIVFDGDWTIPGTAGWVTINLTTPFAYDGTSNLLITINKSFYDNYTQQYWRLSPASGNQLIYTRNDNTAYEPNNVGTAYGRSNYVPDLLINMTIPHPVPSALTLDEVAVETATISWTAPQTTNTITGYAYEYTDGETVETGTSTTTTANLTGLTGGTDYVFKVKAVYSDGESCWSETFDFTTMEVCMTPEGLQISNVTAHEATLNWTEGYGDGQWVLKYKLSTEEEYTNSVDVALADLPYTLTGLTTETTYNVQIAPVCDDTKTLTGNFTTTIACPAPTNLTVAETSITAHGATASWNGTSNSYVVMIGVAETRTVTLDFEDQVIPANFTNDASSPWTVTAGGADGSGYCIIPGNKGVNSSSSDLTCEVDGPCTVSFVAKVSSENNYDWGYFLIDNEQQLRISGTQDWTEYSYELTEGTHTLVWRYNKDNSSYSGSDLFYVDNITMPVTIVSSWTEYTTTAQTYTFDNLDIETLYQVKVKGNCGTDGYSDETTPVSFTTLASCLVPANLAVDANSITAHEATLTWVADNDSYNIMLGEILYLVTADFETGDLNQADFTNGTYAWSVVANDHCGAYCAKSATGSHSETSSLELTVTVENDETLTFSAKVSSESGYDKAFFYIDNATKINGISGDGNWIDYEYPLTAGTHTLSWQYTKDSSVSSNDDCFYVDDIVITNGANVLGNYTSSTTTYNFTGLNPRTAYSVQVQGVCDGETSNWSESAYFTTPFSITKDIIGHQGNDGGWYLIASPVTSLTPSEANGFIAGNAENYDLYYFDQTGGDNGKEWKNYKQNNFDLVSGKGYLYASYANTTLTFSGTPYSGDGTFELTYSEGVSNEAIRGMNLVGNPFNDNATVDKDFYAMNEEGTDIMANATSAAVGVVAPMQGIFVKATEAGQTVTFTKSGNNSNNGKSAVVMNLSQNRGGVIDRAIVRFGGNNLPKFQLFENSTKLYIAQDNRDYAIVSSDNQGEMPVSFKAEKNGTYTISVNTENVVMEYLHLIDNLTGNDVDLLATPSYSFEATTSDYASRFRLVFSTGNANDSQFAFISNGDIVLNGQGTVQLYDVTGRLIGSHNNVTRISTEGLTAGVYMLQLVNGESVKTQKIVVK